MKKDYEYGLHTQEKYRYTLVSTLNVYEIKTTNNQSICKKVTILYIYIVFPSYVGL